MRIIIDDSIKSITPEFMMGVIKMNVTIEQNNKIDYLISNLEQAINETIDISDVIHLPNIKEARDAYKRYGKDPSRYRLAVESLYRRLAKGNKLYRINNAVDLGNIISLETRRSVAVLDYDKIEGETITIRLGTEDDDYHGIGRGKLNITNIPLYEDSIGPFGSATSDTERTMITNETKTILLFLISFNGQKDIEMQLNRTIDLFENYASASNVTSYTVK